MVLSQNGTDSVLSVWYSRYTDSGDVEKNTHVYAISEAADNNSNLSLYFKKVHTLSLLEDKTVTLH
jgi:hypothetical protein